MQFQEVAPDMQLPGRDALLSPERRHTPPLEIDQSTANRFYKLRPHLGHLANERYVDYLKIHKVFVNHNGALRLESIGSDLEGEVLPEFLDASGWAFAESGVADVNASTTVRIERLNRAEVTWQRALIASDALHQTMLGEQLRSDSQPFRIALNLAYIPLMRALVLGDATAEVRRKVLGDTLAIAQLASVHAQLARKEQCYQGLTELSGLIHECNALIVLLLVDDPRYLPFPSSSRADSGYFYRRQTHDITIINQHFGTIKKTIPVEVKAHPSGADRRRYNALILGKNDLVYGEHVRPIATLEMAARIFEGIESMDDNYAMQLIQKQVIAKLAEYQRRGVSREVRFNSKTRFYGKPVSVA